MPKRIEYTNGQHFPNTRLTFVADATCIGKRRRALFDCACGKQIELDISWVKSLNTTSCGCFRSEAIAEKNTVHSHAIRGEHSGAYRSWQAMHQRVLVNENYKDISICERWNSFEKFFEDMGDRPNGLTIERVDNTIGYYPSNCVWATYHTQAQNTRNTVHVTIGSETHSINEWCRIKNIGYRVIKQRRARGMSLEDAITTPLNTSKQGRKK